MASCVLPSSKFSSSALKWPRASSRAAANSIFSPSKPARRSILLIISPVVSAISLGWARVSYPSFTSENPSAILPASSAGMSSPYLAEYNLGPPHERGAVLELG